VVGVVWRGFDRVDRFGRTIKAAKRHNALGVSPCGLYSWGSRLRPPNGESADDLEIDGDAEHLTQLGVVADSRVPDR